LGSCHAEQLAGEWATCAINRNEAQPPSPEAGAHKRLLPPKPPALARAFADIDAKKAAQLFAALVQISCRAGYKNRDQEMEKFWKPSSPKKSERWRSGAFAAPVTAITIPFLVMLT